MDPHVTQEDLDNLRLEPLTHRHLRQSINSPPVQSNKRTKFVNFKLPQRSRASTEHLSTKYQPIIPNKNSILHSPPIKEENDEDRYLDEDIFNGNYDSGTKTEDESRIDVNTVDSILSTANENIPSRCPQILENFQPCPQVSENIQPNLNQITTSTNTISRHRMINNCDPLATAKPVSRWQSVKSKTITNSCGRKNKISNVVTVVVNKKQGTLPPYIWTPSVPRSQPSPRPANWSEHEEPGSGLYRFTFVSNALQAKTKQQIKQMKYKSSAYYQESQSPKQRKKYTEFYGNRYTQWVADTLQHPSFQGGYLMKGMETGVHYPVIHMSPIKTNNNPNDPQDFESLPSSSAKHLGVGLDTIFSQGVYEEVVSWVPELLVTCPSDPSQWARCFIVIGFKTLDGDFNRMENQWREWTGALHIYFNISDDLGLKKLAFYRRKSSHHSSLFTYVVVVEVDTVTKENVLYLLDFVYRMRMKSMGGYIAVYQEYSSSSKMKKNFLPEESLSSTSATAGQLDSNMMNINSINIS